MKVILSASFKFSLDLLTPDAAALEGMQNLCVQLLQDDCIRMGKYECSNVHRYHDAKVCLVSC